jgi:arylsulfatase A-like enzyme
VEIILLDPHGGFDSSQGTGCLYKVADRGPGKDPEILPFGDHMVAIMKTTMSTCLTVVATLVFVCCGNERDPAREDRPNIIIIMADDLGFSDPGCFGGEIETPSLDLLAENGIRLTQMYNCARCCPTRASLMTGKYQHRVGMAQNGRNLSQDSPTLAEILAVNGYHTGMAGKWHLSRTQAVEPEIEQLRWMAHQADYGPFAPLETYPCNRGFDEHWGVIWGVVNYFDPFSLVHNEDPVREVPEDFYMTDFITDKSIDMIDMFIRDDRPFFLYIAHTAPHWPLHALPEDIKKYRDRYTGGWDKLRKDRYARMLDMGLFDAGRHPLPGNSSGRAWEDCEQQQKEANHMTAHAAMVDRMDRGIGRIIYKLKETGEFEHTVIFFLADNGASYERGYPPGFDRPGFTRDGKKIDYDPSEPGPELTWGYLGDAWASAANTPWRYWKKESFEGGIHTPFIAHWPAGFAGRENTLIDGVGHVMDLLPTCLELAGVEYPEVFRGMPISSPDGKSLLPMLTGELPNTHDTLFWEHAGGRAIRVGDWKMSALPESSWELFNLAADRTEVHDISPHYPGRVREMNALWEAWAREMGIKE